MTGRKRAMPKWTKAPADLVALFGGAIGTIPGVQSKKMFGYPAAFVNGKMFSGLFRSSMFLRLSEDDRSVCEKQFGATSFEPMPGRPMREYVVVPEEILRTPKLLGAWLRKGHAYAASLAPTTERQARASSKRL